MLMVTTNTQFRGLFGHQIELYDHTFKPNYPISDTFFPAELRFQMRTFYVADPGQA
jgi:hypothetical protein